MKKYYICGVLAVVALLISGCARQYDVGGYEPSGFFQGLWHGIIVFVAFVRSWFDPTISLYDAGNNGFRYNFGYIIGLIIVFGAGRSVHHAKMNRIKSDYLLYSPLWLKPWKTR